MQHIKKITFLLFCLIPLMVLDAQNHIVLSSGQAKLIGGKLVMKNANFKNSGTFTASNGTVEMTGTATNANSQIQGNTTTFHNLEVDKGSNDVALATNITVNNQLIFTNGKLDIGAFNTTIGNAGSIQTPSATKYVKTSSTGLLTQMVANSNVLFPVGNATYNPMTLNNAGTGDIYAMRVADEVLSAGTSGVALTQDAVNRTWHISEIVTGGSDLTLTAQWSGAEELTGFARVFAAINHFTASAWDNAAANGISGTDPYTVSRSGITSLSPFSIQEGIVTLSLSVSPASVEENSGNDLEYTFSRTGPTVGDVTVNFSIEAGSTATYNTDYTISGQATFNSGSGAGTIVIPNGSASKKLIISPMGDTDVEVNETVLIKITN